MKTQHTHCHRNALLLSTCDYSHKKQITNEGRDAARIKQTANGICKDIQNKAETG